MSDSVTHEPHVPTEVAAAQEPWPAGEPTADEPDNVSFPDEDVPPDSDTEADDVLTGAMLARVAAGQLMGLATPAQIGVVVLGTAAGLHRLSGGGIETFGFLVTIGVVIVAALVLGQGLHASAALLLAQADQSEATARIEQHLTAGLERLAAALEASAARPATTVDPRLAALAAVRHAIRSRDWAEAVSRLDRFRAAHPEEDADAQALAGELAEGRQAVATELIARIAAAREVNDPERVLELRDEIATHALTDAAAQHALDRDLAKWFLLLIHRRLRTGSARPDVAVLAGRVAQSFDGTPEGASLRASLPTLRRAAGLCPRCAQPYKGVADACPRCLAAAVAAAAGAAAGASPSAPASETAADLDDPAPPPPDPSDPLSQPWSNPDPESR